MGRAKVKKLELASSGLPWYDRLSDVRDQRMVPSCGQRLRTHATTISREAVGPIDFSIHTHTTALVGRILNFEVHTIRIYIINMQSLRGIALDI